MGSRDANDVDWQDVKKLVKKRDKDICRLLRILSVAEIIEIKRNAPNVMLTVLDPAHIFPASTALAIKYNAHNIVTLNRYSHSNLDSMRHPLNGKSITFEERQEWWNRIAGDIQWEHLQHILHD